MQEVTRRTTRQRQIICEIVEAAKTHPSADEVYQIARRSLPNLSLATVYRNLGLLVEEGRIREVQFKGDVSRYDGMLEPHEHFYCTTCGSVIDLPSTLPIETVRALEKQTGGSVNHYSLDYYGRCSECSKKSDSRT